MALDENARVSIGRDFFHRNPDEVLQAWNQHRAVFLRDGLVPSTILAEFDDFAEVYRAMSVFNNHRRAYRLGAEKRKTKAAKKKLAALLAARSNANREEDEEEGAASDMFDDGSESAHSGEGGTPPAGGAGGAGEAGGAGGAGGPAAGGAVAAS